MRILLVCPAVPQPPSHGASRLVASQLLHHLGERHAFAVVAAAAPGDSATAQPWLASAAATVEIVAAPRLRHPLSGRPAEGLRVLATALRRATAAFRPDIVHLESPVLAPLARAAAVPCVLGCHESPVAGRGGGRYAAPAWQRLRARLDERRESGWAREWFAGAAMCVVDCEHDRRLSSAHVPLEQIEVIPGGIDAERYAYRRIGHAGRLVFTGDVSHRGNLAAARRLATSILPLVRRRIPRAELLIATTGDAEAAHDLGHLEGVRVERRLADLRPSLWGAAVYVSPLATAAAGRAPRLLEAFALGTPVIASAASLSRLDDVVPGHHVLGAESDADFADAVGLLMREPVVATTLARHARALVERCRTWRTIAQRYDDVYRWLGQQPRERAA